ncbi:hypothetical protein [Clostridium cadaveris]|uniref:hypothetical protein n=1 Tax=Clostridium cadaveris TaxID=1529 RepID=UPI0015B758EF|nr:hypothetical protein [Clostridium cadaveris]NWK12792.1 hypothetical protein [Clostridium cadaveris]
MICERKPKPIKGTKVLYDDKEYKNIISVSRGYEYSNFSYLDENGSECSIYVAQGKSFSVVDDK